MINIEEAVKAFDLYVKNYDMSNPMIKLKYDHTFRVCNESMKICDSIHLSEEDKYIAYLIALLHDIGRFEQAKRFGTFNDSKSIDHADFGCKLLFDEGLIRNFILDDKYDEIIRKCLFNHNKYKISKSLSERELLHAKIIRDADKLDIMYITTYLNDVGINDDELCISEEVSKSFLNKENVRHSDKKTKNDSILTMMSFVFDLNFNYSYETYKKMGFIDKIMERICHKEIFKKYVDFANKFVERKCKNGKTCTRSKVLCKGERN